MYLNGKDWMSQENGAILFVVIRWSNTKNSPWEPGKSDPAYPNYVINSDTNFFPINALRMHISQISEWWGDTARVTVVKWLLF